MIILASGSPRRKQLLELAGVPFEIIVSNADETVSGSPDKQVKTLALRKARAVRDVLGEKRIILSADTLVHVNGRVLGKPEDADDAFKMLKILSGNMHEVYTAVALVRGSEEHVFADVTRVFFRTLTEAEIRAYIETGEPFDKAGAYGVQERGAVLVDRVEGDFYTVVGLPIAKVWTALAEMGYDFWRGR